MLSETPSVNVIQPTPPRTHHDHYRLLYRGSLSLPDSKLSLEGITFTAHLPPSSPSVLLDSPVALALESMRGRPSLRLISIVTLEHLHYECAAGINMYIHPCSTIACTFFENVLCADTIGESGHSVTAVRIGLGDERGTEETDLLVYGTLSHCSSKLRMSVARVVPNPIHSNVPRKPRPDDPAPRHPPFMLTARERKKDPPLKRRRTESMDSFDTVFGNPSKRSQVPDAEFVDLKTLMATDIPALPAKVKALVPNAKGKGKMKSSHKSHEAIPEDDPFTVPKQFGMNTMETVNKMIIKKIAVKMLASRGMPKEHPEFKELFGWITRGAGFAIRRKISSVKLTYEEAERLVDIHVNTYFDGFGGQMG